MPLTGSLQSLDRLPLPTSYFGLAIISIQSVSSNFNMTPLCVGALGIPLLVILFGSHLSLQDVLQVVSLGKRLTL